MLYANRVKTTDSVECTHGAESNKERKDNRQREQIELLPSTLLPPLTPCCQEI